MADNYVRMLRESLEKKETILDQIISLNKEQEDILRNPNAAPEDLDENVLAKERLIGQLSNLDKGFEQLFLDVEAVLQKNRMLYKDEIARMQELIRRITDKSSVIQKQEKANYMLAQEKFSDIRQQVQKVRKSQQAVNTYYKNMMKVNFHDPQFMDNKK